MKSGLNLSKAYLIDSGASNHMVSSRESFTTLNLSGGPSIHMGDNSQILATGRGSIKIQHGEFKNLLYVPSLAANLLYVYQMTHTGSPKQVVFGPDLVVISYISTGKIIVKGVANDASKEYEFSHFLPYSDRVQSQLPFERGGKTIIPIPCTYDNVSIISKIEDPVE